METATEYEIGSRIGNRKSNRKTEVEYKNYSRIQKGNPKMKIDNVYNKYDPKVHTAVVFAKEFYLMLRSIKVKA